MTEFHCPDCGTEYQPGDSECKTCHRILSGVEESEPQKSPQLTVRPESLAEEPRLLVDGILPIEPIVEKITQPAPYSLKLEVTPEQQYNAHLLKNILKIEPYSDLPPKRRSPSPTILLSLVILIVFLSAAGFQIITGKPSFPPPKLSPGAPRINQFINTLQSQAPVLIAFDYHPGFSLELERASQSLLQQLMMRHAYLFLTTTTPTGVPLAERAIERINSNADLMYQPELNYINLGYIPGGAIGLNAIVSDFQSAFPVLMEGSSLTLPNEVQPITSLLNFKLVVIITDSTESSRAWIEQVTTQIDEIPFIVITSSQVEPLLLAYSGNEENNIDAAITGIEGATNYEIFNGQYNETDSIWSELSLSIMVAAGILLIGGFIAIMFGATRTGEDQRGGG